MSHVADLRTGIKFKAATVVWMTIEIAASIGAGIAADSLLLVAFGLDSLIAPGQEAYFCGACRWKAGAPLLNGSTGLMARRPDSWRVQR